MIICHRRKEAKNGVALSFSPRVYRKGKRKRYRRRGAPSDIHPFWFIHFSLEGSAPSLPGERFFQGVRSFGCHLPSPRHRRRGALQFSFFWREARRRFQGSVSFKGFVLSGAIFPHQGTDGAVPSNSPFFWREARRRFQAGVFFRGSFLRAPSSLTKAPTARCPPWFWRIYRGCRRNRPSGKSEFVG